jgi:hypothetical protein
MKTTTTRDNTHDSIGRQTSLKQTDTDRPSPSQPSHETGPKCDDSSNTMLEQNHRDQNSEMIMCPRNKNDKTKQVPEDDKIGIIVTLFETNEKPRRGQGLVGTPMALPPRLPCMPAGQIVPSHNATQKHNLHNEKVSFDLRYEDDEDDEQGEGRPFKRICPHGEHQPSVHMVSP